MLSKLFYNLAMPRLYQFVRITSGLRLAEFVRVTAQGSKAAQWLTHTRRLVFQMKGFYNPEHARILISRMKNVKVLVFFNRPRAPSSLPRAVAEAIAACPDLESLHFRGIEERPTLSNLVDIAQSCSKLRVLQIAATHHRLSSEPSPAVDDRLLTFPSLEVLSLGPGPSRYSSLVIETPESLEFQVLLRELYRRGQIPALRHVNLLGPTEWATEPFTRAMREKVETLICGSRWGSRMRREVGWGGFHNLKCLIIMVEPYSTANHLPDAIHTIEKVEVVQLPFLLRDSIYSTRKVLEEVLRAGRGWHHLKEVVLKLTSRANGGGEGIYWLSLHGSAFRRAGITFLCEEVMLTSGSA